MPKLTRIRKEIDGLDRRILELLNARAGFAEEIWNIKSASGKPVLDPKREAAVIANLKKLNKLLPDKSVEAIYREIFSAIRATQKNTRVAYLGPAGTFAQEAALKFFGAASEYVPMGGWGAVFKEVEKGQVDYGVLPIENSIEGSVNLTLDLLEKSPLNIFGEVNVDVHHNLVSRLKSVKSIKRLYSHPQPLSQCRKFLARTLPDVEVVETFSTAAAPERAAKYKNSAALSSLAAAQNYKLNVIERSVEDFPNNVTRFVVLSYQRAERMGKDKTSIAVTVKNSPGALYELLGLFNARNINLTKIVSRPIPNSAWAYLFYIDFEGHREDKKVADVLNLISSKTERLKLLGSYPRES